MTAIRTGQKLVSKYRWGIVGLLAGAAAGYWYWQAIGCQSGTCAITSNPYRSVAYFGLMGYLMGSLVPTKDAKAADKKS